MLPVACGGTLRNKHNYLKNDLTVVNGALDGNRFYTMTEVLADDNLESDEYFYDVYLLYVPLGKFNEHKARSLFNSELSIGFNELKGYLTGFARIIGYKMTRHGKILNFIEEG